MLPADFPKHDVTLESRVVHRNWKFFILLNFAIKAQEANEKLGVYFLRTNLEDIDEALE